MAKKRSNAKRNWLYKGLSVVAFIILYVVLPLKERGYSMKLLLQEFSVLFSKDKVKQIDESSYLTLNGGWEQLKLYLQNKGYQVEVLFNQCSCTLPSGQTIELEGRALGKYFTIWQPKQGMIH